MAYRHLKATRQPSVERCHPDLSSRPQHPEPPGQHHPSVRSPTQPRRQRTCKRALIWGTREPQQRDVLDVRVFTSDRGSPRSAALLSTSRASALATPQVCSRSRPNILVVTTSWRGRLLVGVGSALALPGCGGPASVHIGGTPPSVSPSAKAVVVGPQPRQFPAVAVPPCVPVSTTTTPEELQLLKESGDTSGTVPPSNLPPCSTIAPGSVASGGAAP